MKSFDIRFYSANPDYLSKIPPTVESADTSNDILALLGHEKILNLLKT